MAKRVSKPALLILLTTLCLLSALVIAAYTITRIQRTSNWDTRGFLWSVGINAVVQKPLLGYGQENFQDVFPKWRFLLVDNAHNIFLETSLAADVIGLLPFLGILYCSLAQAKLPIQLAILAFLNYRAV